MLLRPGWGKSYCPRLRVERRKEAVVVVVVMAGALCKT